MIGTASQSAPALNYARSKVGRTVKQPKQRLRLRTLDRNGFKLAHRCTKPESQAGRAAGILATRPGMSTQGSGQREARLEPFQTSSACLSIILAF